MLEPGVYLDCPEAVYVADPALSGSAFKRLLTHPPDYAWQRASNPLWRPHESDATEQGTAYHVAVFEGLETFRARYATEPNKADHPGALDTNAEMQAWLRERGLKVSGPKAELIARILEADPTARIWDAIVDAAVAGRTVLRAEVYAHILLTAELIERDPTYSRLLSGGLPEVTIVWDDPRGARRKARIDYLRRTAVVEGKTFERLRGRGLVRDLLAHAVDMRYEIQAANSLDAAEQLPALINAGRVFSAPGERITDGDRLALIRRIADHPKTFVWLFVRRTDAPTVAAIEMEPGGIVHAAAAQKIAIALANHSEFHARFGKGLWFESRGLIKPDLSDWPSYTTELPA